MKPVCVTCRCFYRPKKNGTYFVEMMPNGTADPRANIRGKRKPEAWEPYKLWAGDLWECPDCQAQIIVGVPSSPWSEHYKEDFEAQVTARNATIQINDC